MALQNFQYDIIMREYNRRQSQVQHDLEERRAEAFARVPRLLEIDSEVAALSAQKARSLLQGEPGSFDWYSDTIKNEATGLTARETAKRAYDAAVNFVRDFDTRSQNLFLYGSTGVGKTFLSHCIANALLESAHCVLYFSAFDLFDRLAQTAFSKKPETDMGDDFIFNCDLLIIDDLGTELTNSFVSSQLFLCINERIARRKSTIISTNLKLEDFSATYSERTFSRIASNYQMLKLIGKDIRIQKIFLGGK